MRDVTLNLSWYFYLLMEKPHSRYFKVWSPYNQVAECKSGLNYNFSCIFFRYFPGLTAQFR